MRIAAIVATLVCVGAASARAQTLSVLSKPGFSYMTDGHGKVIPPTSNAKPKPGWEILTFSTDYLGTESNHSATPAGYDGYFCTIVKWPRADCNGTIYVAGSVLDVVYSDLRVDKDPNPMTRKAEFGTGVFKHVRKVRTTDIKGYPEDEQFIIPDAEPIPPGQ